MKEILNKITDLPNITKCFYKQGETIIAQGETIDCIYFLVEGECYRKSITEKGEELIYSIRYAEYTLNALIGILVLYSKNKISTTTFIAKTDCYFYKIPEKVFMEFGSNNPELLHQIIKLAVDSYDELDEQYHTRQSGKTANKLCAIILDNLVEYKGLLYSDLPYNNTDIAKMIGVNRVSIVRILRQLEYKNIIKRTSDGIIILDKDSLVQYSTGKKFVYIKK